MPEEEFERRFRALLDARGPRYVEARDALVAEGERIRPWLDRASAETAEADRTFDWRRPIIAQALLAWMDHREASLRCKGLLDRSILPDHDMRNRPITLEPWRVPNIVEHGPIVLPVVIELWVFARVLEEIAQQTDTAASVIEELRDPRAVEPLVELANDRTRTNRTRQNATELLITTYRDRRGVAVAESLAWNPVAHPENWSWALSLVVQAHREQLVISPDLGRRLHRYLRHPRFEEYEQSGIIQKLGDIGYRDVLPELIARARRPMGGSLASSVFRAMVQLGGDDVEPLLQQIRDDPARSSSEREAAESVLSSWESERRRQARQEQRRSGQ